MGIQEHETPWIQRIEELIHVLEGSSISELELTEAGTEIIIRRIPGMMMVASSIPQAAIAEMGQAGLPPAPAAGDAARKEKGVAIVAPFIGVYYAAPSPTSPPFVSIGDVVQVGQPVAVIEAMKVFNEIRAEISGRVTELVATNGEIVQKGDALIRVLPV